jgi:hypothetical protein
MINKETWKELGNLMARSPNLRFSLEYARASSERVWSAVIFTEKGRVMGRATAGEADEAVRQTVEKARENWRHLP